MSRVRGSHALGPWPWARTAERRTGVRRAAAVGVHGRRRAVGAAAVAVVTGLLVNAAPIGHATASAAGSPAQTASAPPGIEDYFDLFVKEQTAASGYAQSSEDAPATVTVITAEEIRRMGYRSLADVLEGVRSFYVTRNEGVPRVGVRGFSVPGDYSSRVLLLVDGKRANDSVYGSAHVGFGGPELYDIARIEIARGSISSVYGSNAFFGVVNLVTRRGAEVNEVATAAEVGSTPAQRIWVGAGSKIGDALEWYLSAAGGLDAGDRLHFSPAFRNINSGFAVDRDRLAHVSTRGRVRWGDVSLTGFFGRFRDHIPTAPYFSMYDRDGYDDVSAAGVSASYERGDPRQTLVTARLGWDRFARSTFFVYDYDLSEARSDPGAYEDRANSMELTAAASVATTLLDDNTMSVGVEYRNAYDQLLDGRLVGVGAQLGVDRVHEPATTQYAGAYAQVESRWLDERLLLSAGLRFDYHLTTSPKAADEDYVAMNPRFSIIAKPVPGTVIKAIYGTAFRAPNAYELHYYRNHEALLEEVFGVTPEPLRPERIHSAELVLEQAIGRYLHASVSGYYYALADMIAFVVYDAFEYAGGFFNTDEGNGAGLEIGLRGAWSSGATFRAAYSLQRALSGARGATASTLPNSPAHMGKASVSVPVVTNRHFVSAEVIGLSSRLNAHDHEVPGYAVVNLSLMLNDIGDFSVLASVKNVLDNRFGEPASTDFVQKSLRSPGRTLWIEMRYHCPL